MMIRVETSNSVYLFDRISTTLVCLSGSHAGMSTVNAELLDIRLGLAIVSRPGSEFYIRSTPVVSITYVENETVPFDISDN
jgi:hypothetical protein